MCVISSVFQRTVPKRPPLSFSGTFAAIQVHNSFSSLFVKRLTLVYPMCQILLEPEILNILTSQGIVPPL